jgi:hypothetical protein
MPFLNIKTVGESFTHLRDKDLSIHLN